MELPFPGERIRNIRYITSYSRLNPHRVYKNLGQLHTPLSLDLIRLNESNPFPMEEPEAVDF